LTGFWGMGMGRAIWSLRLRLHSGLRQRGRAFGPEGMRPKAEALGYLGGAANWAQPSFGGRGVRTGARCASETQVPPLRLRSGSE
jgi:hypothetical protein